MNNPLSCTIRSYCQHAQCYINGKSSDCGRHPDLRLVIRCGEQPLQQVDGMPCQCHAAARCVAHTRRRLVSSGSRAGRRPVQRCRRSRTLVKSRGPDQLGSLAATTDRTEKVVSTQPRPGVQRPAGLDQTAWLLLLLLRRAISRSCCLGFSRRPSIPF